MIRNYWLEKSISILLIIVFTLLVYLSFGHSNYFDLLFVTVLVALLTIFKDNKDLCLTIVFLLTLRGTGEIIYLLSDVEPFKWVYYLLSVITMVKLRNDKHVLFLVAPVTTVCLFIEWYWLSIGYKGPELHYYVIGLAINSLFRHFLSFKAHLKFYPNDALVNKPLDYVLYKLSAVSNIVTIVMISEYLLRHLTSLQPMFVYDSFSYVKQVISLVVLYLFVDYTLKLRFRIVA